MTDVIFLILEWGPFLLLLLLGLSLGGFAERRHFRQLAQREAAQRGILLCNLRHVTDPASVEHAEMVIGQVVIATDYFKTFATSLRNLVGGEMKLAERLMLRARREAVARMLDAAREAGATEVWNLRYEFCNVSMMRGKGGAMQVEIVAYGTAIRRRPSAATPAPATPFPAAVTENGL